MRSKLFLGFLFFGITSWGQTEIGIVNEYIERYIENISDEVDIQQLAADFLFYYEHPIDLNKADATKLFEVPFLNTFQVLEIIEHRKKYGDFISIYELQVLPSFSVLEIKELTPFVSINSNALSITSLKNIWKLGEHQILTLAETTSPRFRGIEIGDTAKSQNTNRYTGSQLYSNLRYRFDFDRNISFGFNAEKDAGEAMFENHSPLGYDYISYYFSLRDIGKIKALQLGDFQANFGQGLTLSTGLAFGKSSIITNSKRNFNGFSAYRSLRENAFLRGGAIAASFNKLKIGAFASSKKIDGNGIYGNENLENEIVDLINVSSIQEDGGFHRTLNEIADKDLVRDLQTGFYAEWSLKRGKVGTVNYLRKLSVPLTISDQPYNQFNFEGDSYFKNGLYYDLVIRNVNLYGEVSYASFDNRIAQIHGALLSVSRNLDLSLVYHNYENGFITLQTNGFGENSNSTNEKGFYTGFDMRLSNHFRLLGYYDIFTFPWMRFQTSAPSSGQDFWAELQYKPSRSFNVYYRYRTETKQQNDIGVTVKPISAETISRHRININYKLAKGIELHNRLEWSSVTNNSEQSFGSLLYQDVIYKPFGKWYQISGRVAYSQIDRFDNRIFSFEQSPLYDYPLFTHGFTGLRFYILTRIKPRRNLDIWFKYGLTQHDIPLNLEANNYTIGSGLSATSGNIRNTFTVQLRYKFK